MERFWRALARSFPLSLPRARMAELVGAAAVDELVGAGLLARVPLRDGDPYPCRCNAEPGCAMRVVGEPTEGAVAVCGLPVPQCPDEPVAAEDGHLLQVAPGALLALLGRALGLRPVEPPSSWRAPVALGVRRFGRERVSFFFVTHPGRAKPWLQRGGERGVRVMLTPHEAAIPADLLDPPGVEWVALADALRLGAGAPALDLSELLLRRRFPGLVLGEALWPAFSMVVDEAEGSVHYGGRPLALERSPMAFRFLALLAARPGRLVSRRELMLELWPDDFTSRGNMSVDPLTMDRRIRQLRSKVGGVFRDLPPVAGLPVDPVENLRTRSDVEGGYRLGLEVGRVCLVE